MDHTSKQFVVSRVIEYAVRFQQQRRRKQLTSRDVHDAIHALGLRPLYSSLQVGVDESLNVSEVVSDPLTGLASHQINLSVIVADESHWRPSEDSFRKRKFLSESDTSMMATLSEKSKFYAEKLINSVDSFSIAQITPPCEADVLITSWFLGLVFTNRIESSENISWSFVRNCVWYLQNALETHSKMTTTPFPSHLSSPWVRGLDRIAQGREIACDSEHQALLIRSICSQLVKSLI